MRQALQVLRHCSVSFSERDRVSWCKYTCASSGWLVGCEASGDSASRRLIAAFPSHSCLCEPAAAILMAARGAANDRTEQAMPPLLSQRLDRCALHRLTRPPTSLAADRFGAGASLGLLVHGCNVLQQVAHAAAVAVLVVVPGHQLDLRNKDREERHVMRATNTGKRSQSKTPGPAGEGAGAEMHQTSPPERFGSIAVLSTRPNSTRARPRRSKQLTKLGERLMPAPASTMEERVSPTKSVDTTASVVKLQKRMIRGD